MNTPDKSADNPKPVRDWREFAKQVEQHIKDYTIAQYGAGQTQQINSYSPEDCMKAIAKYQARHGKSARGKDEQLRDYLKIAHYSSFAWHKEQEGTGEVVEPETIQPLTKEEMLEMKPGTILWGLLNLGTKEGEGGVTPSPVVLESGGHYIDLKYAMFKTPNEVVTYALNRVEDKAKNKIDTKSKMTKPTKVAHNPSLKRELLVLEHVAVAADGTYLYSIQPYPRQ